MGGGGKSSKQTVGYKNYCGASLALAQLIHRLLKFKVGDIDAWTGSIVGEGSFAVNQPKLYGASGTEGGFIGTIAFQPGLPDQMPNSYLLNKLGPKISANRGVSQVILEQCYIGNNPYLKDMTFVGERVHLLSDGSPQWYDEKAAILNASYTIPDSNLQWRYLVIDRSDTIDRSAPSFNDSAWPVGLTPFGDKSDATAGTYGFNPIPNTIVPQAHAVWLRTDVNFSDISSDFIFECFIDNGLDFYVNGVKVISQYYTLGGYFTGSIDKSHFVQGVNHIAVRGTDDTIIGPSGTFYFAFRLKPSNADIYDLNPAHILRECLMDTEWGYGYDETDLNMDTFTTAADALYSEQLGLSYFWDDDSTDLDALIDKVLDHIDGELFVDRDTLQWTLKLVRPDYDADDLPELRADYEVLSISDYTRPEFEDLVNIVTVDFYNTGIAGNGSISVSNPALFLQQGNRVPLNKNYDMCCNPSLAARLAQRELNSACQPLAGCTVLATSKSAKRLKRGGCFKLTSQRHNFNQAVMRITGISYGDGKTKRVKITCVQDKFALPQTAFTVVEPPAWVDPSTNPVAIKDRIGVEVPYAVLLQNDTQANVDAALAADPDLGYVGIAGARVNGALNADIWIDVGGGYEDVAKLDFCPSGELQVAITQTDTSLVIINREDLDELVAGGFLQIGDEFLGYDTIDTSSGVVTGLKRGVFDSIPSAHDIGAGVLFSKDYIDGPNTQYASGEVANIKLQTNASKGSLDLSDAPIDSVALNNRAIRPYPPGNFKINDTYYPTTITDPDVLVSFVHRDRILQQDQIVDSFAADVGPEPGTTYNLRAYIEDVLDLNSTGNTTSPITWTPSTQGIARVELESQRDGYTSYFKQTWSFLIGTAPPWEPSKLFVGGKRGGWYDANDLTTMFQDTAGTTPVTAVGQSIALWKDKSGNGNDLSQATAARRPKLQKDGNNYYVEFLSANSTFLEGPSTDVLAMKTESMMAFFSAAFYNVSTVNVLMSRAFAGPGTGRWSFEANDTAANQFVSGFFGVPSDYTAIASMPSSNAQTLCGKIDRVNGNITSDTIDGSVSSTIPVSSTNYNASFRVLMGAYASSGSQTLYFNGRVYNAMLQFDSTLDTTLYGKAKAWSRKRTNPAGSKKAWRVVVIANSGAASNCEIRHIEFRSVAGTAEPATSGTAFASTTLSGYPASAAFGVDSASTTDAGNAWCSATGNKTGFVGYIFAADQACVEVAIKAPVTEPTTQMPSKFRIESSSDTTTGLDGNWHDETGTISATGWTNGETRLYTVGVS